jgi:uncharacterized protein (DUF427 family)
MDATTYRAIWNGTMIAESDDTIVVDGYRYFPIEAVHCEYLSDSSHRSVCGWKGQASYYDVVVDGKRNRDAAWYYPHPKPAAGAVRGRIGFWQGVRIKAVATHGAEPADQRRGTSFLHRWRRVRA